MFKGLVFSAALVLAASEAMASRARMTALGQNATIGSQYIMDSRNVFHNPAYVAGMGGTAQFETGAAATAAAPVATPNPEGGFYQSTGNGAYGLWLGGDNGTAAQLRSAASAAITGDFLPPDNAAEFFYGSNSGSMSWGASLNLTGSNSNDGTNDVTESSYGVRLGASTDAWDVGLVLGLGNAAAVGENQKFTGSMGVLLTAGYNLGAGKVYFNMGQNGATVDNAGTETKLAGSSLALGYARNWDLDGGLFFYSVEYSSATSGSDNVVTTTGLPITVGIEKDAADWLVVRGSVRQPILMNSITNATLAAPTTFADGASAFQQNATQVAGGVGLNFDGVMIDATLIGLTNASGSANGKIDATNLLGQASLTFNF